MQDQNQQLPPLSPNPSDIQSSGASDLGQGGTLGEMPSASEVAAAGAAKMKKEEVLSPVVVTPEKSEKPKKSNFKKNSNNNLQMDVMSKVLAKIRDSENVLVALSNDPSVDEMAAALALTMALDKEGKHATAIYSGKTPNVLEFLRPEETFETNTNSLQDFIIALNKDKADHLRYKVDGDYVKVYITPYKTTLDEGDLEFSRGDYNVDFVISLNVPAAGELDGALREYGRIMHDATSTNITNKTPGEFGDLEWFDPNASSISEMVANLVFKMSKSVDSGVATALLTGLVSATDKFTNELTTPGVMMLAGKLMGAGADQQDIMKNISQDLEFVEREEDEKKEDKSEISISHNGEEGVDEKDGAEGGGFSDQKGLNSEDDLHDGDEQSDKDGVAKDEGTGEFGTNEDGSVSETQGEILDVQGGGNTSEVQSEAVGVQGDENASGSPTEVVSAGGDLGIQESQPSQQEQPNQQGQPDQQGQQSNVQALMQEAMGVQNSSGVMNVAGVTVMPANTTQGGYAGDAVVNQILENMSNNGKVNGGAEQGRATDQQEIVSGQPGMNVAQEGVIQPMAQPEVQAGGQGGVDYGKMIDEAMAEPLPGEVNSGAINQGVVSPGVANLEVNPAMVQAPNVGGIQAPENVPDMNFGDGAVGFTEGAVSSVDEGASGAEVVMSGGTGDALGGVGAEVSSELNVNEGGAETSGLPLPGQEIAPPPITPVPEFGSLPPAQMPTIQPSMGMSEHVGVNEATLPPVDDGTGGVAASGVLEPNKESSVVVQPENEAGTLPPVPGTTSNQPDPSAFRIPGM